MAGRAENGARANIALSGVAVAVSFMTISGAFLWLAQRQIPIGTAYAVWTGIGAAGTFLVGIHFYGDPTSLMRYLGVALIIWALSRSSYRVEY